MKRASSSIFMFNLNLLPFGGEQQDSAYRKMNSSFSGSSVSAALDTMHHNILMSRLTSGRKCLANLNVREMSPDCAVMHEAALSAAILTVCFVQVI